MKYFIFIVAVSFCHLIATAQTSVQKFVYHQAIIKDVATDKVVEDFGYGNKGVILFYKKGNSEWISVSLGTEEVYSIKVVQIINDFPNKDIKVEMSKGGVMKDDQCIGTIAVFRIYDLTKNKSIPEFIRTQVDNASIAFEFNGIIRIEN